MWTKRCCKDRQDGFSRVVLLGGWKMNLNKSFSLSIMWKGTMSLLCMCLQDGWVKNENWMNVYGGLFRLFARIFREVWTVKPAPNKKLRDAHFVPIMVLQVPYGFVRFAGYVNVILTDAGWCQGKDVQLRLHLESSLFSTSSHSGDGPETTGGSWGQSWWGNVVGQTCAGKTKDWGFL